MLGVGVREAAFVRKKEVDWDAALD